MAPLNAQVPLERPALRRRGRGLWPVAPAQCDASRGSVTIVMVVINGDQWLLMMVNYG